ncbi:1-Cys peroxiredoxin [Aphelenchoides bicaudatus]|nr:1-Cys peroxiredoxin [Aphelenchoides bicaudatus]
MRIMKKQKCVCRYLWNYELHGLSSVIYSKSWVERLSWSLLISLCMASAVFTTYSTFSEYLEKQTATLLTKHHVKSLQFPSIVVCPKNPDAINVQAVIREIKNRIPHITRLEAGNLISFAIAGSGFHNMEEIIYRLSPLHYQRLNAHFERWKGSRTYKQFYDDLFLKYGYKCEDLFHSCYIGYQQFNCCERFEHQYVMLRGKCFRLQDHFQKDPDVFGKLLLFVRQMPSPLVERDGLQQQIVVFLSDNFTDVSTFPRFYVNLDDKMYVRMWLTELRMLDTNKDCSMDPKDRGRATCYVEKYHTSRLFYLSHRYPNFKVCDALRVVYNYNMITNAALNSVKERCLPHCNRQVIRFKFYKADISNSFRVTNQNVFIFQGSYVDLEYDRYEEVILTTIPGFISELGGQSGLFLAFSIISLFNVFVSLTTVAFKRLMPETNKTFIRSFHEWIGDSWSILFSHPADFTPVCTTELARAAELAPEFQKRNVKMLALSSDSAELHSQWIKDIVSYSNSTTDGEKSLSAETFPFEIIADEKRELIRQLGMEDLDERNTDGIPLAARAVFVIGPDRRLKLSILYPATTGRNFDEILRVIDSLQLTAMHNVATPADWRNGQVCMLNPRLSNAEANNQFPNYSSCDVPSGREYIRFTKIDKG